MLPALAVRQCADVHHDGAGIRAAISSSKICVSRDIQNVWGISDQRRMPTLPLRAPPTRIIIRALMLHDGINFLNIDVLSHRIRQQIKLLRFILRVMESEIQRC